MAHQCAAFDASQAAARTAQLELGVGIKAAEGQLLTMTRELGVLQVRKRSDATKADHCCRTAVRTDAFTIVF
jgi:hypothetical protein